MAGLGSKPLSDTDHDAINQVMNRDRVGKCSKFVIKGAYSRRQDRLLEHIHDPQDLMSRQAALLLQRLQNLIWEMANVISNALQDSI